MPGAGPGRAGHACGKVNPRSASIDRGQKEVLNAAAFLSAAGWSHQGGRPVAPRQRVDDELLRRIIAEARGDPYVVNPVTRQNRSCHE